MRKIENCKLNAYEMFLVLSLPSDGSTTGSKDYKILVKRGIFEEKNGWFYFTEFGKQLRLIFWKK